MRGYLKASGVIHQCTRCYSLRNLVDEPEECPACRVLLGVRHTGTRVLPFGDISTDRAPQGSVSLAYSVAVA